MLQIKNLTIIHKKDLRTIIKDFSFSLNKGDKAVIIGEEGNGKSTLLKLIYNNELVDDYVDYTGEIIKNNIRFGYLMQELTSACKSQTVYEFCSNLPGFYDLSPKELEQIAYELGLKADVFYSEQLVGSLSGGEKIKLQFAGILIQKPNVLLLDEPSNDIDIETLEWLENFINTCDLPVLFISHDETLLEGTANVIIHLEQIRRKTVPRYTVMRMSYKQYVEERLAKFERQEQIARKEQSEYEKQQERFRKIQEKVEHQQNAITRQDPHGGKLLKKKMKAVKSMEKRFDRGHENMTQIPEMEESIFIKFNDQITIPNGKTILDLRLDQLRINDRTLAKNVILNVRGPEKICIIGKNGIGKSTLLKIIADELLGRQDMKAGYMPQNYEELLDFNITPIEYLATTFDKEEITRIRTYLGSMKYTADEMNHTIGEMSGGQKAKLLLLKLSLEGCNVLILDEPTRNFSPISNPAIRDVLKSYGGTVISISHDRKFINEVCNKIYTLTEIGLIPNRIPV